MVDTAFYSSDGDIIIVPQQGALTIVSEFGVMNIEPREIAVV